MKKRRSREDRGWNRTTIRSISPSDLVGGSKERLFSGLEGFANAGDSPEEYVKLSKLWPDFWPVPIFGRDQSLAWDQNCHTLFLFCRDALREVWAQGSRANPNYLPFLLGMSWTGVMSKPPLGLGE